MVTPSQRIEGQIKENQDKSDKKRAEVSIMVDCESKFV